MDGAYAEGSARGGDRLSACVFWGMVLLGYVSLAACVLLPEWRIYQALHIEEQAQAYRLEEVKKTAARYRREIEALRSDPAAVSRLAQREYNYHRPVEKVVPVSVAAEPAVTRPAFAPELPEPPEAVAPLIAQLPTYPYDRVFCEPSVRSVVLCMSLGLIITAFVLFCRPGVAER